MIKKYNVINNAAGWAVFAVSFVVYLLTLEPTTSLWDVGEFIASSYKLQIGHPPGAPLFLLLARIASLFAGGDTTKVALMINALSALASAFTILFLFWTITMLTKRMIGRTASLQGNKPEKEINTLQALTIFGSGIVGSLAYTFSDTFWFSAVEGEVYATSSFFTAFVFWAILKWERIADEKYSNRWLVLIAFFMGLSTGVHLLNLLAIPAIVMVVYFKKYNVTRSGTFRALILSALLLGIMVYMVIPGIIWLASRFELVFVNGPGLPYYSGILIYLALLAGLIIYGLVSTYSKGKVLMNTVILCFTMITIGYSSYAMIMLRSLANPPLDENNPETAFSLLSYLNRDQYGDRPLVYGNNFNARLIEVSNGKPFYSPVNGKYEITSYDNKYKYANGFSTLFPRMWSSDNSHINVYLNWAGLKESNMYNPLRNASGEIVTDESGSIRYDRSSPKNSPGFFSNMRFFLTYQTGHMYLRYFMWNFVGRQNDTQADGGPLYGNWISGISFIDSILVGSQSDLPDTMKNVKSRNTYYFLPFLLGLAGLLYQSRNDRKYFWVVMLLFILTGLAIVVYLNQTPLQPRERDYAYAGSFYAFSIWIGLGVAYLAGSLKQKHNNVLITAAIIIVSFILVPLNMAAQNWDDHNRSGRFTARDIAANYLNSCAPNALLFTNGDNDTFPLWYAQEVEGIRTDVRVVNLMLLNMDWYADQMQLKAYESDPLPMSLKPDHYRNGTRDRIYVQNRLNKPVELKEIMEFVSSGLPGTKVQAGSGELYSFIPTTTLRIPVDSSIVIANGTVSQQDADKIVPFIEWELNEGFIYKPELIVLDILACNNWERPVYYASLGHDGTLGLEEYMQLEGFVYRLVPIKSRLATRYEAGKIATDILYDNLMNKLEYNNINNPDVYLDDFHVRTLSILRFRTRFIQLAQALLEEGDTARAASVLDRCLELTPEDKVPYDHTLIQIADLYHFSGRTEKANAIVNRMKEISDQKTGYFLRQNRNFIINVNEEITYNIQVLQSLAIVCRNHEHEEMAKEIDALVQSHYQNFLKVSGGI